MRFVPLIQITDLYIQYTNNTATLIYINVIPKMYNYSSNWYC